MSLKLCQKEELHASEVQDAGDRVALIDDFEDLRSGAGADPEPELHPADNSHSSHVHLAHSNVRHG
jgi:hypothetical protein